MGLSHLDSPFDLFIHSILANGIFGIKGVEILLIKLLLRFSEYIAKALKVNDLALAKEFYNVTHVGIVRKP